MKNILNYKGYFTKIEYSAQDGLLFGKIEGINDLVNFESDSPKEIEKIFHEAVDDYLALCEELEQNPNKAYSGSFNIRIDPTLHRAIALHAIKKGKSLNSAVEDAIQTYMDDSTSKKVDEIWNAMTSFKHEYKNTGFASTTTSPYNPIIPFNRKAAVQWLILIIFLMTTINSL